MSSAQKQKPVIGSETDINSKNSRSYITRVPKEEKFFIKLGADNRKAIDIQNRQSLNSLVSCMSVVDIEGNGTVDIGFKGEEKVHMVRKNMGNRIYEELEFDPFKGDEKCNIDCVIF